MIVAQKDNITKNQQTSLDKLFNENAVKKTKSVHYETVTKNAGANHDRQDITMIVPQSTKNFDSYIHLATQQTSK